MQCWITGNGQRRPPRNRRAGMVGIRLLAIAAIAAICAAWTPDSIAGVVRDDVADTAYTSLAAQPEYASVGRIKFSTFNGSGALVSSRWVLAAAHLVNAAPTTFMLVGESPVNVSQKVLFPGDTTLGSGYDLALMRLDLPITTAAPAVRSTGAAPTGATVTVVGFGATGTGLTGATEAAGTKRAGTNVLELLGNQQSVINNVSANYLLADFDNPHNAADSTWGSSAPLPLEYLSAVGDSGGGAFVNVQGNVRLAAVTSFIVSGGVTSTGAGYDYGDLMAFMRISMPTATYDPNDWIDDTIAAAWKNAAGGSAQTASNWQIGNAANTLLPDNTDILKFNISGTYTVSFAGANTYNKILARQGSVTLDLGGTTQSLSSLMQYGSVTVGRSNLDLANLTLTNGTLSSTDAFLARGTGSTGSVTLSGAGTLWNLSDSLYVGGGSSASGGTAALTVNAGTALQVAGALKVWANGSVMINGGSVTAAKLQLNNGMVTGTGGTLTAGSIEGNGTINFDVQTAGIISPGFSTGQLNFAQDLVLQSGASLVMDLGGLNPGLNCDRLNVTGAMQAAGALQIKFINGFGMQMNGEAALTIVNGTSTIAGSFVNAPNNARVLTTDLLGSFIVHYGANSTLAPEDVVLTNYVPYIPGDFDADGDVDGADFVAWQIHFPSAAGATMSMGDADADGDVDGADFVAWQTHFLTVPAQGFAAVPEPAGWILGVFSLAALVLMRRIGKEMRQLIFSRVCVVAVSTQRMNRRTHP
ncbi:MAG: trypsin-like serine protease [Pirellulales bacterium]|nr:trypsin-like serine protease [Pirellulales bacterium]